MKDLIPHDAPPRGIPRGRALERDDPSLIPSLEELLAAESDPEVRERLRDAIRELESRR